MTARAQSRKHRGYRTQRALVERWRANGLAPHAHPPGAGESGADVLDGPPGVTVEIKARTAVSLVAALAATAARAPADLAVLVWRHDGQGEAAIDRWTVTMSLVDFEDLYRRANGNLLP
jgi:hypothetical protein